MERNEPKKKTDDKKEVWEVKRVRGYRVTNDGKIYCLLEWDDSWEPLENLDKVLQGKVLKMMER